MSKIRVFGGLAALAAMLILVLPVYAKGPPDQVTISGPGIRGEIVIAHSALLNAFSFYEFNDLNRRMDAPAVTPGEGYHITRYVRQNGGGPDDLMVWDTLTYYLNPDGPGYLYFDGLDPSIGGTEGQGEWYLPSEAGDAAMKQILAAYGVGAAGGGMRSGLPAAAGVAALGLLIVGAGIAARRSETRAAAAAGL